MTCPTCSGLGVRIIRRSACACTICFGTGSTTEPASAEVIARRLHHRALRESQRSPYKALLCLQAAVVLLGVTGAPKWRLHDLARQGMAVALVRCASEDVTAFLRDVNPYLDGRTQSALIDMMLRLREGRKAGREIEIEEVLRG